MKVSNSSLDKYRLCPKMYDLHYNARIRPDTISSALFFGSAIDQALNVLLLEKKKTLTPEEEILSKLDIIEVFESCLTFMEVNGEKIDISKHPKVVYFKSDFDEKLLESDDWSSVLNHFDCADKNDILVKAKLDIELNNYLNWLCLRRKGHLFLEAYEREVMPRIREVVSIQRQINLPNEDGDNYIGVIDFIATWEDGKTYIFDNKTSSRKYPEDAVVNSTQLMTYSEDVGIDLAGYIVMLKPISWDKHNSCNKCDFLSISKHSNCPNKCGPLNSEYKPKVTIQVLLGEVSAKKDEMFVDIQHIIDNIKDERFSPDWNKCSNVFGKKCPYYDYCRNGSMENLIIATDKKA